MTRNTNIIAGTAITAMLLSTTAVVAMDKKDTTMNKRLKDDSYVTLSGTVSEISDSDEFTLTHAGGNIKVDTNDKWPNLFAKGAENVLKVGDKVRVTGEIDDDLFTGKEIEATSVAHDGANYSRVYWTKEYYAFPSVTYDAQMKDDKKVSVTGTITEVKNDEEFMLYYGNGTVQVEAGDIAFGDKQQALRVGDRVTVYGTVDKDWFQKKELEAERIYRTEAYLRKS